MGATGGVESQGFSSIGNDLSADFATMGTDAQSQGIQNQSNATTTADQGSLQQSGGANAQSSINLAQGGLQTNQQNFAAGQASLAVASDSNQKSEALQLAAAEEKARDKDVTTGLGAFA